eukprot:6179859-Pleurochrysis_carterae.AAC.2
MHEVWIFITEQPLKRHAGMNVWISRSACRAHSRSTSGASRIHRMKGSERKFKRTRRAGGSKDRRKGGVGREREREKLALQCACIDAHAATRRPSPRSVPEEAHLTGVILFGTHTSAPYDTRILANAQLRHSACLHRTRAPVCTTRRLPQ